MRTKSEHPYKYRLDNWIIEQHGDCPNFIRARQWAKANGYVLKDDVSYNGFILLRKVINESTDPHDGSELDITVYYENEELCPLGYFKRWHRFQQSDMEAEFGAICSPTTYRYKMVHGLEAHTSSRDIEEIFTFALNREAELNAEYKTYRAEKDKREAEWLADPSLKEKYMEGIILKLRSDKTKLVKIKKG
jgi:hypothetical protein